MSIIEANEIMRYLPHDYPVLLLDRVTEIEDGIRGVGVKNVTANEECFKGHFPGNPILPGALIVEAMAQTAAVVLGYGARESGDGDQKNPDVRLAAIQEMKFRKTVTPGDRLMIEVRLIRRFGRAIKIAAEATVSGEVVACGTMILAA
jgi:3-hydroxyacyl-[acyl-carrier-protein] dehydratase